MEGPARGRVGQPGQTDDASEGPRMPTDPANAILKPLGPERSMAHLSRRLLSKPGRVRFASWSGRGSQSKPFGSALGRPVLARVRHRRPSKGGTGNALTGGFALFVTT